MNKEGNINTITGMIRGASREANQEINKETNIEMNNEMYGYINSKAIRKHLEWQKYQFNIQEAIYIARICKSITYEEKLKLYERIIDAYPDCNHLYGDSIKEGMKKYIDYKRKLLDEFKKNNNRYIYNIDIRCQNQCNNHINRMIFSTYEKACEYIRNTILNEKYTKNSCMGDIYSVRVEKKTIDEDCQDLVLLNNDLEIMNLVAPRSEYGDEIEEYCCRTVESYLYGKNFELPVPFKTGDLLECSDGAYNEKKKFFIFDKLCMICDGEDGHCDSGYYSIFGYTLDRDGKIVYGNMCDEYLDTEYCGDIFSCKALNLNPLSHLVRKDDNVYC